MNGTTRAILSRELEDRKKQLASAEFYHRRTSSEARGYADDAERLRSEVAEIQATLDGVQIVGEASITIRGLPDAGGAPHIHNG